MAIEFIPNDHIDLGVWDVPGSAISLTAWVQQDTSPADPRILMKGVGTASADHWWGLVVNGGNDKPEFRLFTTSYSFVPASTTLVAGTWYHICGTYDGADMRMYVNGVEEGSENKTGAIKTDASASVWIGDQPGAPTERPWDGKIEDVRVYDRALTAGEVSSMHAARGVDNIVRGLVSRWLLNGGAPGVTVPAAAGTIKDVVGSHSGTQSGDPLYAAGTIRTRRRSG